MPRKFFCMLIACALTLGLLGATAGAAGAGPGYQYGYALTTGDGFYIPVVGGPFEAPTPEIENPDPNIVYPPGRTTGEGSEASGYAGWPFPYGQLGPRGGWLCTVIGVESHATAYEEANTDTPIGYVALEDTVEVLRISYDGLWSWIVYDEGNGEGWIETEYLQPVW